jgi:NAD-dependent deacetylase
MSVISGFLLAFNDIRRIGRGKRKTGMAEAITDAAEGAAALQALLDAARLPVAFTGAGISTECGVPDFRSPGSPWMVNKPIPFDAFVASAAARREAWRRKFAMDDSFRGAVPGRGHRMLADLVRAGRSPGVITQNIDNLHQDSGLAEDQVVELHGNGTYAACLDCRRRHELSWVRPHFEGTGEPPSCEACGGVIKSATISFGQAMPERPMRRARELALGCDLLLAIGSSLVVFPAAGFPLAAKQNGARLAIINREPTEFDAIADAVIRADIGETLSLLAVMR